jgi:pyruvate formate lyase activating enzyme
MKEARLYSRQEGQSVTCHLCAHRCTINEGKTGVCQVRENAGGTLYSLVYGQIISRQVDPIEKKPLFHFYPGSSAYSIAAPGCNFRCQWCQNADISQMPRESGLVLEEAISPEQIVEAACGSGGRSIAYTYTEPTIWFEYTYDTGRLAREAGLANVYVTNGYMTTEMLESFSPYLDAANVDLKSFRDATYRKHVGARLQPVLDSLQTMVRLGIWVEVTTLLIPGINDDPAELRELARFIAGLGPEIPWHVSRFFPAYRMTLVPPTPLSLMERARDIGREEGLRYIYLGNVPGRGYQDTICPVCGRTLILRRGTAMIANDILRGGCPDCGNRVAGIGLDPEKPSPASPLRKDETVPTTDQ